MQLLFGGAIALVLLGLYVYAVIFATQVALCLGSEGCTTYSAASFTGGYVLALTTIGGLLSALVVAVLAITTPRDVPFLSLADPKYESTLKYVTGLYLLTWIVAGVVAFVVGVMMYPDKLPTLSDLGKTWLGLAVAAGFAYFKVTPAGTSRTATRSSE
jgi:hypothetical protein